MISRVSTRGSLTIILGLGVVGPLGLDPDVARAQPAPDAPAPDAQKGDAKELMQLGVKLVKSKDYLGALAVFKDANKRFPSAKILLNIGTTLKLLTRNAEAVNTYQQYLDASDADPARRAEVTEEITRLETGLGRLQIAAPPEAELRVGSEDWVPAASAKLYRVTPGPYTLQARRKGYKPFEVSGELAVGQVLPITVTLVEEPKASPVFITVPAEGQQEEARSRLGALAIGHFDINGGAAAFVGAVFDVTPRIQVNAAGILGPNFGGFAGANFAFLTGTLRPIASLGVPIFFNDGARVGIRGAAGLEIVANRHFAVILELGVEHNFNPQQMLEVDGTLRKINATSFIPALGASARL